MATTPSLMAAYLSILGAYSAAMILFGRWLALDGLVMEEIEDTVEPSPHALEAQLGRSERWMESATGDFVPRIDRIHSIPLEDPVDSSDEEVGHMYLHCASMDCWCGPRFADCSDSPELQGTIVLHNAMTPASAGWVNIGENLGAET